MLYLYNNLYADKKVYFTGPEMYYPWGLREIAAAKAMAEAWGVSTSRPGDRLEPDVSGISDKNAKADAIFADLVKKMRESDYLIANIESFRGRGPDSGTAFDVGMAYALGLKNYVYSGDKRNNIFKDQFARLDPSTGAVLDFGGRMLPEKDSPVNAMISCSAKVLQGESFQVALQQLFLDLEEDAKAIGAHTAVPSKNPLPAVREPVTSTQGPPWKVYVAGAWPFENNWLEFVEKVRALCFQYNLEPIFPAEDEGAHRLTFKNPWSGKAYIFNRHNRQLQESNVIIADLNPFKGLEPDSGTAWECGAAYMYGHKMYGYMDSLAPLVEKIPNTVGADGKHYDMYGAVVEDFDYPVNFRFGSSMKLFEGKIDTVLKQVALDLGAIKE